jgi:hypothetical protein
MSRRHACRTSRVFYPIPSLPKVLSKLFFRQRGIVDLDTLTDEPQMRRCVQANFADSAAVSGWQSVGRREILSEDGRDKSGRRSFAFGTSNMNGIQAIEIGRLLKASTINNNALCEI